MESSIASLLLQVERVAAASTGSTSLQGVGDPALLGMLTELGVVQRLVDAIRVRAAGELADRSRESLGAAGLARRACFARPALMLAELWGITVGEAGRLSALGLATRERTSLVGEPLPARYPLVGCAIENGTVGIESAAAIIRELEAAAPRCSVDARDEAERFLVEFATERSVRDVAALARLVRDRLDQDGAVPRDEIRHARRSLRLGTTSDGTTHLDWYLEPGAAGLVTAGIDAVVGEQLRRNQNPDAASPDHVLPDDERTLEQLRSDAAVQIFRHVATCRGAAGDLPAFTMVVKLTLESLLTGRGTAEIDGVAETISASTVRTLAADAEIIPMVLGGRGEVLDVGVARRLFTRAQRLAFAERDGGCAFGGCDRPPSYAEAHHIRWWSRGGRTDLANGILLCSFHHHRVQEDGWEILFRHGVPYFVPPPHVDPSRRPRRGGRLDLAGLRV
jgi:hypothetical protein